MNAQEKARKYMLKDIIRHNLHFWWIILIVMAALAAYRGYDKYQAYEKRFASMALTGSVYQVSETLYAGGMANAELHNRVSNVKELAVSNTVYEQYRKDTGYSLSFEEFSEIFTVYTEFENDYLKIIINYPAGCDDFLIMTEEEAAVQMKKFMTSAMTVFDSVFGKGQVQDLGQSRAVETTNIPTEEHYTTQRQETIKAAVIGAIMGFVAAAAVITLLYLLSTTIKTAQELAARMHCKLIALLNGQEEHDVKEYQKVRMLLSNDGTDAKILHVMALQDAAEDTAMALVRCYCEQDKKVLYIDCAANESVQPQTGKGLADYVAGKVSKAEVMQPQAGYTLMVAGAVTEQAIYESTAFVQLLAECKKEFDVILIRSCDTKTGMDSYAIAQHSDKTIVSAQAQKHTEQEIERVVENFALFDIACSGVMVYEPHK